MIPRWHVILGLAFTLVFYLIFPETSFLHLALMFFASVLIDFDHYTASVLKTGKLSLRESFKYHRMMELKEQEERKRGVKIKGDFHFFHTIGFHALVLLLGYFWIGFLYIFAGMLFHSITDLIDMLYRRRVYKREYFFLNWLQGRLKQK